MTAPLPRGYIGVKPDLADTLWERLLDWVLSAGWTEKLILCASANLLRDVKPGESSQLQGNVAVWGIYMIWLFKGS